MEAEGHKWIRSLWEEEQITFLFEIDADGRVLRQIEMVGPEERAQAAADLAELLDLTDRGDLDAMKHYERQYGRVADQYEDQWDHGYPGERITEEQFARAWRRARSELRAG